MNHAQFLKNYVDKLKAEEYRYRAFALVPSKLYDQLYQYFFSKYVWYEDDKER